MQVADASPVPVLIYNFPTVTAGQDLDSDVLAALAQHPSIVGTKLSCGNIGKLARLTGLANFAPLVGKADVLLPALRAGGAGGICALANVAPRARGAATVRALDVRAALVATFPRGFG